MIDQLTSATRQHLPANRILRIVAMALALITAGLSGIVVATAQAQTIAPKRLIELTSTIQVERTETAADGSKKTNLVDPSKNPVFPGDRLQFTLTWTNNSTQEISGFSANNPLPAAVKFESVREDWAIVSVDGGVNWGKLSELTVANAADPATKTPATRRAALPEDVTHIRWVFVQPIPAGASGTLLFHGSVK